MGECCCCSGNLIVEYEASSLNKNINKLLVEERRREGRVLRTVLFGARDTGKSCFVRQTRISAAASNHSRSAFTDRERRRFRSQVIENVMEETQKVVQYLCGGDDRKEQGDGEADEDDDDVQNAIDNGMVMVTMIRR